jgi:hypothetical protein
MKIVKFESKEIREKKECVEYVNEIMEKCTNFIFCFSENNLETWRYIRLNLSNVESLGCLEVTKHRILHDVLSDDDDPDEEYLPEEVAAS